MRKLCGGNTIWCISTIPDSCWWKAAVLQSALDAVRHHHHHTEATYLKEKLIRAPAHFKNCTCCVFMWSSQIAVSESDGTRRKWKHRLQMRLFPLIAQHRQVYLHSCYGNMYSLLVVTTVPSNLALKREKKKSLEPAAPTQASFHVLTSLLYIPPDVSFQPDEV